MPMYEFRCNKCSKNFEELASADEKVTCPHCGSTDTERLMSACCCMSGSGSGSGAESSHSSGGGCCGCSGGHCSTCGH
ncbi:MAG: zinc ribbon domain-containing protein [Desulfovibrionaceae bacterium]|nr:zinc ribbon domain-containing protein [Desulfovibrionaceae bacterium]